MFHQQAGRAPAGASARCARERRDVAGVRVASCSASRFVPPVCGTESGIRGGARAQQNCPRSNACHTLPIRITGSLLHLPAEGGREPWVSARRRRDLRIFPSSQTRPLELSARAIRHTPRAGAHLHARARPGVAPRMRPFWKAVYLPGMHARVERASAARGGALKMPACNNLCEVCHCPTRSAPSVRPAGLSAHPCAQASQVLFRAPGCASLRAGERGAFPRAGRTRARRH